MIKVIWRKEFYESFHEHAHTCIASGMHALLQVSTHFARCISLHLGIRGRIRQHVCDIACYGGQRCAQRQNAVYCCVIDVRERWLLPQQR